MTEATPGALYGLKVLELSTTEAGAWCGKLLAGLGAEVLKVEAPSGDESRQVGPYPGDVPDPETCGTFLHLNTNKLGITLDVSVEKGSALLGSLLEQADILVETYEPGWLFERGLGYEAVAAANPGLVYVSITPFGLDGPYASYAGTEIVAYALGGYMMLTGEPEREPLKPYGNQSELQAGQQAAVATMVALFARDATGRGQQIDVSVMEAAAFMLGAAPQAYVHRGEIARRAGARLCGMPPRMSYPSTIRPCADGYVHVHANTRHPDLLSILMDDPRLFAPELMQAPLGHADKIDALMDPWLRHRPKRQIVDEAQTLRLPFTEVQTPEEVAKDPHLRARDFWKVVRHPIAGEVVQTGAPIRLSDTFWRTDRAPLLGEHNEVIFRGRLGLTEAQLADLQADGVI